MAGALWKQEITQRFCSGRGGGGCAICKGNWRVVCRIPGDKDLSESRPFLPEITCKLKKYVVINGIPVDVMDGGCQYAMGV